MVIYLSQCVFHPQSKLFKLLFEALLPKSMEFGTKLTELSKLKKTLLMVAVQPAGEIHSLQENRAEALNVPMHTETVLCWSQMFLWINLKLGHTVW